MAFITVNQRKASNTTLFHAMDIYSKGQPWNLFSTIFKTKDQTAYFDWLGEFSGVKEFIDTRDIQALRQHDFSITSRVWEKTIGVKKRDLTPNLGMIKPRIDQMGLTLMQHPNKLFFDFLKGGDGEQAGGGAKGTYPWAGCFDTQTFFSNSHPVYDPDPGVGATNDNITTGTGVDTVAHVTADFESAQQGFFNLHVRSGDPMFDDGPGAKPYIICAAEDIAIFTEAFLREFDTSNNRNPYFGQVAGVIPNARLNTDTTYDVNGHKSTYTQESWFLVRGDMPIRPLIMMETEPFTAEWFEGDRFMSDQYAYGARAEYNLGFGFWQVIQKIYNA